MCERQSVVVLLVGPITKVIVFFRQVENGKLSFPRFVACEHWVVEKGGAIAFVCLTP